MEKIINIRRTKNYFFVKLSNDEELTLLEQVVTEFNLYINKEIDKASLEEIKKYNQLEEFYLIAVKSLNKGIRSKDKLIETLKNKGARKNQIDKIIAKLENYGYFDENRLINEIVEDCENKCFGYKKIINTLKQKGFSENKIDKIKFNNKNEQIKAEYQTKLFVRKNSNVCFNMLKKKTYSYLLQKGFNESISESCVNKFCKYDKKHERNMLKLDYAKCFSSYSRKYKGLELKQKIINHLISKGYQFEDINYIKEKIK